MPFDQLKSFLQEVAAGRNAMPGRRAGRMRQRNEIELLASTFDTKTTPDDLVEFPDRHELRDSEFADRDNEAGLQNFDFAVQPRRTIRDLPWIGDTIASTRCFAGETTADCCEVYFPAHRFFVEAGRLFKPAK